MRHTLSFYSIVSASSVVNLASRRIPFPFQFKEIKIYCDLGQELQVQYKIFYANDDDVPASGEPAGTNVLATLGHVDYIVGEDGWLPFKDEIIVDFAGGYIKVHANNADTFDHYVDVVIEIEDDFKPSDRDLLRSLIDAINNLADKLGEGK